MLNVLKPMLQTSLMVVDSLTHLNNHSTMICPIISIIRVEGII